MEGKSKMRGCSASRLAVPGISADAKRNNYHLLGGTLGQCVAVAQVIDFNVFDVIAVSNIDFGIQLLSVRGGGRRSGIRCGTGSLESIHGTK